MQLKTKVYKSTLNPVVNESFVIPLVASAIHTVIQIVCWDHDAISASGLRACTCCNDSHCFNAFFHFADLIGEVFVLAADEGEWTLLLQMPVTRGDVDESMLLLKMRNDPVAAAFRTEREKLSSS